MKVWCVWGTSGSYEDYTHDLLGIFGTEALAEAHSVQVRPEWEKVDVVEDTVLDALPVRVPYVMFQAHIRADGTEDMGLGYWHEAEDARAWSHELKPLDSSRIDKWTSAFDPRPDLVIEAIGSDETLVAAEYARLLDEARQRLRKG